MGYDQALQAYYRSTLASALLMTIVYAVIMVRVLQNKTMCESAQRPKVPRCPEVPRVPKVPRGPKEPRVPKLQRVCGGVMKCSKRQQIAPCVSRNSKHKMS